jgi:NADH dehydrogenase/NADH:ubiquinone oxidoreductase subunit G
MEVTIDGIKIELEEPVSVLAAARQAGVRIPTLCWHPRVSILGACRLCMIEVEGINRLLAACTTQVSEGMTIITDTPQLRKVRETMLELLLCRHPLDCPTCVKGGECELQELAYNYSDPKNRFPENPAPYPVKDPSPFIERDPKKCVLCRRCVRVCREVRGVTVLSAMERGYHKRVGTFFQRPLDSDFQEPYNCEFCGACIDICPVGALNSKQRKFQARTWEGDRTETVCPFCSVGCLLTLQVKEGELVRTLPREGRNNQDQACFRGRFGCDYVNGTERLTAPLLRREGKQVPAERGEALAFLAGKIRAAGSVEALVSSTLTSEEMTAVREFMKGHLPEGALRVVDTLGLEEQVPYNELANRDWEDLDEADLVLVAGQDFTIFNPVAGVRTRVSRAKRPVPLVVLDSRDALLGGEADLWLRPAGAALPLLLAAVIAILKSAHGERLKAPPDEDLLAAYPAAGVPGEVEKALGLPSGALGELASRLAQSAKPVFLSHRGWYDPAGRVPALLAELDRLLQGGSSRGIIYLGRDCNSRGLSGDQPPAAPEARDLLLLFGADPRGTALPSSPLLELTEMAGTTIVFDTCLTKTALAADAVIPLPHFAEKEGSFRASNGLDQRLERAMTPPPGVFPLRETLEEGGKMIPGGPSGAPAREESGPGTAAPSGEGVFALSLPAAGERCLVLRAIPVADHRLRIVSESEAFFPGEKAEVHPGDLPDLGVEEGAKVRLTSGGAVVELEVRADLKTPPGQVHLPFDPENEKLAAFAAAAERPEGWPIDFRRLSALDGVTAPGGEG